MNVKKDETFIKEFKKLLDNWENYEDEDFFSCIINLDLKDENYAHYLTIVENLINEKMMMQTFGGVSKGDTLLEELGAREKEVSFIDVYMDFKYRIGEIFKKKLNTDQSKTFSDDERNELINSKIDNFTDSFVKGI